jgi:hypothetical protein
MKATRQQEIVWGGKFAELHDSNCSYPYHFAFDVCQEGLVISTTQSIVAAALWQLVTKNSEHP